MKRSPTRLSTLVFAVGLLALVMPAAALAGGNAAEGKKTYDILCMPCHGVTGRGDGPAGAAIQPPPRNFSLGEFKFDPNKDGVSGTDEDLRLVIKKGAAAFGGNPIMVPWMQLSDTEVANVIAHIRALDTSKATSE